MGYTILPVQELLLCGFLSVSFAALPCQKAWEKSYGGDSSDAAASICRAGGSGFVFCGATRSRGAGGSDLWVVALNSQGDTVWTRVYGGDKDDSGKRIRSVGDGFIVLGETSSLAAYSQMWVLKLNTAGDTVWTRTFGGPNETRVGDIVCVDGGVCYTVASTTDFGAGGSDGWVIKLDSLGDSLWSRTYGSEQSDYLTCGCMVEGGDVLLCGYRGNVLSGGAFWFQRITDEGMAAWDRSYISCRAGNNVAVTGTIDGNFLAATTPCAVSSNRDCNTVLMRVDTLGDTTWTREFGMGGSNDLARAIVQSSDGAVFMIGATQSFGANGYDLWVTMTNQAGEETWSVLFGTAGDDHGRDACLTEEDDVVVAGETPGADGSSQDAWVLKLDYSSPSTHTVISAHTDERRRGARNEGWSDDTRLSQEVIYMQIFDIRGRRVSHVQKKRWARGDKVRNIAAGMGVYLIFDSAPAAQSRRMLQLRIR